MKTWQKLVLFIIVVVIMVFINYELSLTREPITTIIEKPVYYEDLEKIHKLEDIIQEKEGQIVKLKQDVGKVREILIIQKEELKLLEPDSGVLVLRNFLEEYTKKPNDSLPTLINDSLIVIDTTDLFNINCVFLEHNADQKIIEKQEFIISIDSTIKLNYDSIIRTDENIRTNLESALSKQKNSTNIWKVVGITGIALSTVLLLLNIL